MPQISLKETRLYIVDGSGSPNTIEVTVGEGNITWSETRELEYTLNRGKISSADGGTVREGDDQAVSVNFDLRWDEFKTDTSGITPIDAIKGTADAVTAGWISVDPDVCTPYAVDLQLQRDIGSCFTTGGGTNRYERYLFSAFRWESNDPDVDAGQISFSGTCQVTRVKVDRSSDDTIPFATPPTSD